MSDISHAIPAATSHAQGHSAGVFFRSIVIALTAFLTLVDLFATQAILPSLTAHYGVTPAADGLRRPMPAPSACSSPASPSAISRAASTAGAASSISLVLLAIPTALLAYAPNLTAFAMLRVAAGPVHGLGLHAHARLSRRALQRRRIRPRAFAAYITGNVASNLIGRLISAGVADHFGLAANFYFFAVLNLPARVLVYFTVEKTPPMQAIGPGMGSHFSAWIMHLKNPSLRASFAIGFCILFAFIGTFTYVNFVLVQPPFSVDAMTLGFIYFVFLPVDRHDAARRPRREALRHAGDLLGRRLRVAALGLPLDAVVEPRRGARRHGAGRRRHLLRAGHAPPASSAARRPPTAARRAASISPSISSAA